MVVVTNLAEPVVDHAWHVYLVADPVVLPEHAELDVVTVQRYATVLVDTSLRPQLCQRRQLRVPFLQSIISYSVSRPCASIRPPCQ